MDKNKTIEELKLRHQIEFEQRRLDRERHLKELWENLKPFNEPEDIPEIPVVDTDLYQEYYVPKLIKAGGIPKNQLIDGQYYIGDHRRCTVGRWNKEKNVFEYNRTKFNMVFIDTCNHFQDDDGFALFVPIRIGTEEMFKNNNYK